jgi:RimJ/RimL family protein N-acetyltransferase
VAPVGPGRLNHPVFQPDYPIKTERLTLRPYEPEDFDAALDYWSRDELTRYLYLPTFDRDSFAPRFDMLMERTQLGGEGDVLTLAVVPDGVGYVVGDVTLMWHSELHKAGEIGFMLHSDHQGKGYAREASLPLLRMGFDQLGLHRIAGRLDGRNEASAKVLAGLGMRREAHLVENEWVKGEWTDEMVFAMLEEEWRARSISST